MRAYLDCYPCFFTQALKTSRMILTDEKEIWKILSALSSYLSGVAFGVTPPEIGREIYRIIAEYTGVEDPYFEIKNKCTKQALALYPEFKKIVANSDDSLLTAAKLAIAGNIIDFGIAKKFDLEKDVREILAGGLTIDDYQEIRSSIYREYGKFISSLRGCYVTAEDVETNVNDMANVFSGTRFTTCIPKEKGGSGNPSVPTARGVVSGMEAALEFCGKGSLKGKIIAVQGMGNVGGPLIGFLFNKGVKKIIAYDTDVKRVESIKDKFQGKGLEATAVSADNISFFKTDCDILSPNATGGVINPRTIPLIKAKIICGAANNQLEDSQRDDKLLFDNKIIYIPDFLTNRMGIVNAADEQYGYVNNDPLFERHLTRDWKYSIYQTSLRLLKEAGSTGEPTAKIAMRTADRLSLENHPLFGHRGQQIIDSLVADKWHMNFNYLNYLSWLM